MLNLKKLLCGICLVGAASSPSLIWAHGGVDHEPREADVATGYETHHTEMEILKVLAKATEPVLEPNELDEKDYVGIRETEMTAAEELAYKIDEPLLMLAAVTPTNPSVSGSWSNVFEWDVIGIHANLLPNGKVLVWDATPDDFDDDGTTNSTTKTRVRLWDPEAGATQPTNYNEADLFCAGSSHLWDGRVLFTGGDGASSGNSPILDSTIYNPFNNTWTKTEDMNAPRWYAGIAALPNGEMLTVGGTNLPPFMKPTQGVYAEVFEFDETWRGLSDVPAPYGDNTTGEYQWMQTKPNGDVAVLGPHTGLYNINTQDEGEFFWSPTSRDSIYRGYGSYALYEDGKVLISGGGLPQGTGSSSAAVKSAVLIDLNTDTVTEAKSMNFERRQHNLTVLADGSVLATGGIKGDKYLVDSDRENQIMAAEIWKDGEWTVAAEMTVTRQYHSIALLLQDGSVLSAGGGYCGECFNEGFANKYDYEIYYPPYLFDKNTNQRLTDAQRPNVLAGPDATNYNQAFNVTFNGNANNVKAVHFIKLGSVTHSQNQGQRLVKTTFQNLGGNRISVQSPANRNLAPPGHYMMIIVDDNGYPSKGHMMKIGQPLMTSGQVMKDTILLDTQWNYYEVETNNSEAISLQYTADNSDIEIFLEQGGYPTSASPMGSGSQGVAGSMEYALLANQKTYIGVNAPKGTNYRLSINLDGGNTDPGPTDPENPVDYYIFPNNLGIYSIPADGGLTYEIWGGEKSAGVFWGTHFNAVQVQTYEVYINGNMVDSQPAQNAGYYDINFANYEPGSQLGLQVVGLDGNGQVVIVYPPTFLQVPGGDTTTPPITDPGTNPGTNPGGTEPEDRDVNFTLSCYDGAGSELKWDYDRVAFRGFYLAANGVNIGELRDAASLYMENFRSLDPSLANVANVGDVDWVLTPLTQEDVYGLPQRPTVGSNCAGSSTPVTNPDPGPTPDYPALNPQMLCYSNTSGEIQWTFSRDQMKDFEIRVNGTQLSNMSTASFYVDDFTSLGSAVSGASTFKQLSFSVTPILNDGSKGITETATPSAACGTGSSTPTTPQNPVSYPSELTGQVASSTALEIFWTRVDNMRGYEIEANGATYTNTTGISQWVPGLTPKTNYTFRVFGIPVGSDERVLIAEPLTLQTQ